MINKRKIKNFLLKLSFNPTRRQQLYGALADIVENGIPLTDALKVMRRDLNKIKDPIAPVISEILSRMEGKRTKQALSIGQALVGDGRRVPSLVPEIEGLLIHAADQSGNTYEGFRASADLLSKKEKMRSEILRSMSNPLVLIGVFIGMLLYFSSMVIPAMEEMKPRNLWPPLASISADIADNAIPISIFISVLIVLTVLAVSYVSPYWKGRSRDFADRYIPPFNIQARINGAIYLSTISGFLRSGVPFSDAIKTMSEIGSPYMRWQSKRVYRMLGRGRTASEALTHLPIVPKQYHWLINTYNLMNDVSESMKVISEKMLSSTIGFIVNVFDKVLKNLILVLVAAGIVSLMGGLMTLATSMM